MEKIVNVVKLFYDILKKCFILLMITFGVAIAAIVLIISIDYTDIEYLGWSEHFVEGYGSFKLPFGMKYHQDVETGLFYFTDLFQKIRIVEINYQEDNQMFVQQNLKYSYDTCTIQEIKNINSVVDKLYDNYDYVEAKINNQWKEVCLFQWIIDNERHFYVFTDSTTSKRYGKRITDSFIYEEEYIE